MMMLIIMTLGWWGAALFSRNPLIYFWVCCLYYFMCGIIMRTQLSFNLKCTVCDRPLVCDETRKKDALSVENTRPC